METFICIVWFGGGSLTVMLSHAQMLFQGAHISGCKVTHDQYYPADILSLLKVFLMILISYCLWMLLVVMLKKGFDMFLMNGKTYSIHKQPFL